MEGNCQNCNETISRNFCANCGQKTSVHRYSFIHFIRNDLINGIWNVDIGVFFTIKELFTRPGHSIREFINGKRVKYFNVVTLLLIILAISEFVSEYAQVNLSSLVADDAKEAMNDIEKFTKKYPKSTLMLTIPLGSIFSFLWFRKSKLNLTEHFVLNSYKTVAELIIGLIFTILTVFYINQQGLITVYSFVSFFALVYSFWYYKQFFSDYGYSKKSLILRSLGVVFSYMFIFFLIGIVMEFTKRVT